jgi:hypothetical protein
VPEANVPLPRAVTGRMLLSTVGGAGAQVQNVNGGGDWLGAMSAPGIVSRVTPVHTAMRNCTRDEGRSFEAGSQVLASNRCKLLSPSGPDTARPASSPDWLCSASLPRKSKHGHTWPPPRARVDTVQNRPESCDHVRETPAKDRQRLKSHIRLLPCTGGATSFTPSAIFNA